MSTRSYLCLFVLCEANFAFAEQPAVTATPADTARPAISDAGAMPPATRDLVNRLNQNGLQQVIEQLRSNYVDPNALTNQEINEATVEGLISRLGPGATIETKAEAEKVSPNRPFKSDLIQKQFGYVRLGSFAMQNLAQLDDALSDLRTKGATGLILDLRTMPAGSEFDLAAAIADRFIPKGKVLFKLVGSKEGGDRVFMSMTDPIFSGPVATLVSSDNAGTAEAIAGALRSQVHSLIFGQKTSGRAVEYAHYPIEDRLVLTVAVSELVIPGAPPIFPTGLLPDIAVQFPKQQQDNILALSDERGLNDYIFDEERPHTNEAALVAGKNPDLDAYETYQATGKTAEGRPKDIVLQRAIDFLTTVDVYRTK
jgi:C-terminal processing protease CtpA/Prc